MSGEPERSIEMYNGKVFGIEVSSYAKEKGYLDFRTLACMLEDVILNNSIRTEVLEDWEIVAGEFDTAIMQDFIISKRGYELLKQYTDELVFYNEKLDVYIWAVSRWGTAWSYELTNTRLIEVVDDGIM